MPNTSSSILFALVMTMACTCCYALDSGEKTARNAGFYLPDSLQEVTFRYKRIDNLILIPVTINDSIRLNLILDTGCRNVVLFGKRFSKKFEVHPKMKVEFSGLGSGSPVNGQVSLNNKVAINAVLGERIPVVIVPDPNLFGTYTNVDGVIGYDIFIKFEVELQSSQQLITFRPAQTATRNDSYNLIPIRVEDSRPVISSSLLLDGKQHALDVMIDTGSSLGLVLKSNNERQYSSRGVHRPLGRGLNGTIEGTLVRAEWLLLQSFQINRLTAGVVHSDWSNTSSIGMDVLREYSVVLNYCKGYIGLKRDDSLHEIASKRSQATARADF